MAHTKELAQSAKVPWCCAIPGTFYARRIHVYQPFSCYTKEQLPILMETHASSMCG